MLHLHVTLLLPQRLIEETFHAQHNDSLLATHVSENYDDLLPQ